MMPRGAGSGMGRSRFVSDCSWYFEWSRICVRKNTSTRAAHAPNTTVRVRRSRRSSRCGWKVRSEEHTSELQSRLHLVCRLLLEKKKQRIESRALTRKQHGRAHEDGGASGNRALYARTPPATQVLK